MDNKSSLFLMITLTFFTVFPIFPQNPFGQPSGPQPTQQRPMGLPPGMSEADTAKFQREMAEFQKEFESLSKDEQDKFFKSMDEAVKKIDELSKTDEGKELLEKLEKGTISDEELDSLVNTLVADEKKEEPVVEKAPEPEKPKPVLTSKHEKVIDAINALIAHTIALIVKANTMPELPSQFKKWSKHKLKTKKDQTWNELKTDIDLLVNNLNKLLERDPITKEYYHLDALLKNEALHNNILKVVDNVAKYEPNVEEVPLLGAKKMSKESKKAFQQLINEYHEALYVLHLTDEITKLVELFGPRAKQLREAEEKAVKQAEITGKKPIVAPPSVTRAPYYGQPSGPMPSYGPPPAYRPGPAFVPTAPRPFGGGPSAPSRGLQQQPTKKGTPLKKAPEKKEISPKEKDKKDEEISKAASLKIPQEQEYTLSKIDSNLDVAMRIIKDTKLSDELDKKFVDDSKVDLTLAVETLPELVKSLNIQRGVLGDLQQLHRKIKGKSMRALLQKRLKKLYGKHEKEIDVFANKIEQLEKAWPTAQNAIPIEKRYAYFGVTELPVAEEEAPEMMERALNEKAKLETIKTKIPAAYSLFEIQKLLKQVKEAINHFADTKLPEKKK